MVSKPANWEILGYPEIPQPWGKWQKLTKSLGTSWKRWGNLKARRILLASHFELAQCLVASCMQSVILLNMTSVTTTGLECSGKWGNCRGIYSAWGLVGLSGVARICCEEGQRWKCHGALTVDFGAGCSSCSMTNSFVTNAVLIERAVSCWHLHQLISQATQYLDSRLSDLLQSELKWSCWKSRGHVPQCPIASDATGRAWWWWY